MDERPSLSVVIPTRDTRELTLRCLESLRRGGVDALEAVVVDDGSTDGTAEAIASGHPHVIVLRNAPSLGFTASANRGLAVARGRVVLLLNSDTEVGTGGLAVLLEALSAHREIGVAGALLHYPDGRSQWSSGPRPGLPWLFALASGLPSLLWRFPGYGRLRRWLRPPPGSEAVPVAWVTGAALAVRRQVLDAAGALDESFRLYAQDADFCLRVRDLGWEVCVLPKFHVLHHQGVTIGAGREGRSLARQPPDLLWPDLVQLVRKRQGDPAARRAAQALRWGAGLRAVARVLLTPFIPRAARRTWREETRVLQRARRACR